MINKYYEIIWFLKKIYYKLFLSETRLTGKLRNPYREYLFQELKEKYGKDYLENPDFYFFYVIERELLEDLQKTKP